MAKLKRGVDPCTVEGCESLIHSKELCTTHYNRNYLYGSTVEREKKKRRVPTECTALGCTNVAPLKRGLYCEKHYWRLQTHGTLELRVLTVEERFWARVDVSGGPDACWHWQGKTTKGREGYGNFYDGVKNRRAHRYAYELANNVSLTSATPVHHKCGITLCVNPIHLQATTSQENTAEMLERQWYLKRIADLEAQLAACKCG